MQNDISGTNKNGNQNNNNDNYQPQDKINPLSKNTVQEDKHIESNSQGLEVPDELKNPDFSDPNFDYHKYDEMMQKYAKDYLMKEEEKKYNENDYQQQYEKYAAEELSNQMQNNLNINSPQNQYPNENNKYNQ